ncbi:MAG: Na+/H+ antiporter NhaA [Actinobacteria bacterium]|nr:Na+/H+ antiporter NhaA [Actinomycetota bacterium]
MTGRESDTGLTWLGSNRTLARTVGRPMVRFLGIEASGGILLMVATVVALVWANSPWSGSYYDFWHTEVNLSVGDVISLEAHGHPLNLAEFVNDVLMAVFFFVVGLEIKREMVAGELRRLRVAALPIVGALGGMVVPALIYLAINRSGAGSNGWGIPMATDIAFAIGIVSLLGRRVPTSLKVFLLTLAIVDDIGAILVIAVFYTSDLSMGWLLVGVATMVAVVVMTRAKVWYTPFYFVLGVALWYAMFRSGVHTTIAGVAMGLMAPARPLLDRAVMPPIELVRMDAADLRDAKFRLNESVSVASRLEHLLHPVTGFVIIPVFALANAGVEISGETLSNALTSDVTLGIVFGLVVGKIIGVSLFSLVALRLGLAVLPAGTTRRHIVGISAIAGIGFTVSLFVTGLALDGGTLQDEAKVGILVASIVAAAIGVLILRSARVPYTGAGPEGGQAPEKSSDPIVDATDREQSK